MGVAPKIDDLSKTNAEFQKYIDDQSKAMKEAAGKAKADMDAAIKTFYADGKWDDAQPFTGGTYQHLETSETWSLDHVAKIIDSIRGAVFGGSAAPEAKNPENVPTKIAEGTTKTPPKEQVSVAAKAMAGMEFIIASAAFDIIQGILTSFTTSTNASIVHNFAQKELVPGLSLFVTVMENQYQRNDFFTNQVIIQNFYIFDARFSIKRAADIAKFNQVQSLITQQASLEAGVEKVSNIISELDASADNYLDQLKIQQNKLDSLNGKIEGLGTKIKELRNAKNAALTAHINKALARAAA